MTNWKKLSIGIIASLALFLGGCGLLGGEGEEGGTKTVKLGLVAPLSGDAAAYGEQIQRIINFYLPKLNEKYEADNYKFELIAEDGKCSGSDAVSSYQKLKDIDGVSFVIGGVCSSETLAIAPLTEYGGSLVVSGWSSNPDIEGASPYTFTLSYNDNVVGQTLAEVMSKHSKIAVITEQNDFNVGIQKVFLEEIAKKQNVEVVADETFPKGATNFRALLQKVKNANPDAILLNPNIGVTAQNLIKQLAEIQSWDGYQLYSMTAYMSEEALEAAPEELEGMIIVDSPKISDEEFTSLHDDIEASEGTLADLGKYYSASTLDILNILTELIVELGEDPKAVRDALVDREFDGFIKDGISFKNSSFPGVDGGMYVVKDGKAEFQK
jgi:branched-chain amino acid transport system substrate-binding protein